MWGSVRALPGGEGAPDLTESVTNFFVNSIVLAIISVILKRDLDAKQKALKVTDREELLSRLQVRCAGHDSRQQVKAAWLAGRTAGDQVNRGGWVMRSAARAEALR